MKVIRPGVMASTFVGEGGGHVGFLTLLEHKKKW